MSKRETIDLIRRFNPTARAEFLAAFGQGDLLAYLHQLQGRCGDESVQPRTPENKVSPISPRPVKQKSSQ
jgi:hypothetical protein